jgi:hypothetical protein
MTSPCHDFLNHRQVANESNNSTPRRSAQQAIYRGTLEAFWTNLILAFMNKCKEYPTYVGQLLLLFQQLTDILKVKFIGFLSDIKNCLNGHARYDTTLFSIDQITRMSIFLWSIIGRNKNTLLREVVVPDL